MLYKEGMIVSGQTLRNSFQVFIEAKTEQRHKCQNDRDPTVSTVTEMRRDLTVSNAETQTVSTVTEMRRDSIVSIVEIQTSQMSRPNCLYRD